MESPKILLLRQDSSLALSPAPMESAEKLAKQDRDTTWAAEIAIQPTFTCPTDFSQPENSQELVDSLLEFEAKHILEPYTFHKLTQLLREYHNCVNEVQSLQETITKLQSQAQERAKRLWLVENKSKTLQAKCGDGIEINHTFHYNTGQFQVAESAKLSKLLYKLRSDANTLLYRKLYENKMAKIQVQEFIDRFLCESKVFGKSVAIKSEQLGNYPYLDIQHRPEQANIKELLDILFHFERHFTQLQRSQNGTAEIAQQHVGNELKSSAAPIAILDDVHGWIVQLSIPYIKFSDLVDRRYIFQHLMFTPGIENWAKDILAYLVSSEQSRLVEIEIATIVEMLGYVTMLKKSGSNIQQPTTTVSSLLWEEDYSAFLDQIAIPERLNDAVDRAILNDSVNLQPTENIGDLVYPVTLANDYFQCLNDILLQFSKSTYTVLLKRLAQTICQLSHTIGRLVIGHNQRNLRNEEAGTLQTEADSLVIKTFRCYLSLPNIGVRYFLSSVPVRFVSVEGLWNIVSEVFRIAPNPKVDFPTIAFDIDHFCQLLLTNAGEGVFLLQCLGNISLVIEPQEQLIGGQTEYSTRQQIILAIAYVFFHVAYLNDTMRDTFYKDVRDTYEMMCGRHPLLISSLLKWTVNDFDKIGNNALYLFRSLNLAEWHITQEDIGSLQQLLCSGESSELGLNFTKYIIENLNYSYKDEVESEPHSRAKPWEKRNVPFLPYSIHSEVAFMILGIAQRIQPTAEMFERTVATTSTEALTYAIAPYIPTANDAFVSASDIKRRQYMDWCWGIILRLQLFECPMQERATEIDESISKIGIGEHARMSNDLIGSNLCLIVYTAFMLSSTSRNFLRFDMNRGWEKIQLMLRGNHGDAIIHMFANVVPGFAYMHGDDFFNHGFTSQLLDQILNAKVDASLTEASKSYMKPLKSNLQILLPNNGLQVIVGSHAWMGKKIDLADSLAEQGGFSYLDLILHSWIKIICMQPDWMWKPNRISLLNYIAKLAFTNRRHDIIRGMLEIESERLELLRRSSSSNPSKTGHESPRNPVRFMKSVLADATYPSLLTGEWSMMTLASSSLFKTPNVEQHFFYFAFEALLQETIAETKTRKQLALQLKVDVATRKFKDDMEINSVVKRSGINLRKSVEFFTVYRWLQHILIMPFDHNLLPLFLQMFFSLYFCNIGSDEEKFNFFYGHLFFSKRENLIDQLKKLLAQLKDMPTHTDSKEITVNLDQDQSMKEKQSLYHAMYLWLGDARLQADTDVIDGLPAAYLPSRLTRCRMLGRNLSDPRFKPKNLFDGDTLWMDLVCLNHLVMEFDDFPWVSKVSIHQPVLPVSRPGSSIDVRPHTPIKGSHSALNMAIPSIKLKRPVTALPLAEILELSPQDLFGDMLRILHTHARQFDQLSIQHKSLDSAYLKKLENLYLNKKATSTFQVPCKKVPEGICRKPATFHLDQQELQVEEDVENQLSDNRNQVSNLVVTHIDPRICVQSLQALTTMTEMTKLDDDQISAAQSRKACEAVIFLFEAFRDSASEFPPAKLLSRQFAQMAASSFRLHPELTDTLIQHMGMDDRYINLLYPAFEPMSQPSQFVDLYKKICLSNDYSCAGQLKLISKFDVVKWVNTDQGSSKHQRLLWYEVAFEAIKKLGRTSNDRPQERALSYRHSSLAVKLLRSAYEKYAIDYEYVDVLSLIIKTYSSKPMNTYHLRAFMEFLGIPLDFIRRAISPGQQNKDISLNTLDRDGLIRILGVIIDTWSKVNHNCLDYLYNSAGSLYDLLLACLCDGRLTLDAPEEIVKSSALRFVFDAHRPLMMSGSANRSKEFDQVAEGFLMTVKTIIASRNSKIDTITILEQCLDYYISLQSSTESQWMKILQRDLLQLPWKDMTPNAQVLSTLLKTSEKLAQSSDDSYLAYQHFVTRLLLEWPANNELLEQSSDTLRLYTKLHFIVLQHIEEAELDGQEVIKVLNASVLTCIPQVSSDKEFVEEIQHSLRTSWPTPLESFKPLMDATNGHMQSLHYCLLWFRTLTKIDTPESCTLKLALEYITYVTSLLSSFIESPGINFTNNAIPDVIIDIITALDTMSTREELETKLDILVPALGDIISLLNRCSPNSEEYTAIRNAIMDTIEKLNNIPIAVLHVASLHSIRPYTAAILIEKCVQQELATSRKSIDETWTLISKHLQVLRGDTDDLLHQCLENFCILTLYGRCVAELLLCKTYADECKIAEEVAAFLSITTVPLIVASETTKLVLLLSQFADIFSKKNQDTKLEEFELLAALVSVHRTLYQWAEGKDSHHIAQTGLMSSFGDKWRNGNSSAISIEWKLYSRLLCGFIGRHLAPLTISQSGLTNRPSAIESWQEWIDNTYKIKEYTQYSEKTAKGFELCQNAPIYQLDKVVRSLAHEIFQEVNASFAAIDSIADKGMNLSDMMNRSEGGEHRDVQMLQSPHLGSGEHQNGYQRPGPINQPVVNGSANHNQYQPSENVQYAAVRTPEQRDMHPNPNQALSPSTTASQSPQRYSLYDDPTRRPTIAPREISSDNLSNSSMDASHSNWQPKPAPYVFVKTPDSHSVVSDSSISTKVGESNSPHKMNGQYMSTSSYIGNPKPVYNLEQQSSSMGSMFKNMFESGPYNAGASDPRSQVAVDRLTIGSNAVSSTKIAPKKVEIDPETAKLSKLSSRTVTGENVNEDNIVDGYVQFVFAHDPMYASDDVDSIVYLKKKIMATPKTQDLTYSAWDIYALVMKLHSQELKNWSQLVGELGHSDIPTRPQFAQRIKRWMQKYKIDRYFDYLLGNPYSYDAPSSKFSGCLTMGTNHRRKLATKSDADEGDLLTPDGEVDVLASPNKRRKLQDRHEKHEYDESDIPIIDDGEEGHATGEEGSLKVGGSSDVEEDEGRVVIAGSRKRARGAVPKNLITNRPKSSPGFVADDEEQSGDYSDVDRETDSDEEDEEGEEDEEDGEGEDEEDEEDEEEGEEEPVEEEEVKPKRVIKSHDDMNEQAHEDEEDELNSDASSVGSPTWDSSTVDQDLSHTAETQLNLSPSKALDTNNIPPSSTSKASSSKQEQAKPASENGIISLKEVVGNTVLSKKTMSPVATSSIKHNNQKDIPAKITSLRDLIPQDTTSASTSELEPVCCTNCGHTQPQVTQLQKEVQSLRGLISSLYDQYDKQAAEHRQSFEQLARRVKQKDTEIEHFQAWRRQITDALLKGPSKS